MIDTQLKAKLYESIEAANKEHPYENWHASSIAECGRAHYFKRMQVPAINKPRAGKILRWTAGHSMEEAIREHIENVFPNVESNVRLTDKILDLTGEFDNRSGKILIEIKSVHDYAFKESKDGLVGLKEQIGTHPNGNKKWGIKEHAYLHHIMQNHVYAKMIGDIEEIVFVYISLSGRMCVYREQVSQDMFNEIDRRLEVLNKAWAAKEPPQCICLEVNHPLHDSVMKWCNYRDGNNCCSLELLNKKES